ncbi:MAG: cyclic nucleotide-binding domain-containing protein [Crocosphaera sp.]|nr:cyclic nucleotide-binding domain-containing protein [Crocosphaera sp.]
MSQTFLQELSNEDIDWLMAKGKRQQIKADSLIIQGNQPITEIHLVINGCLTLSVLQDDDHALHRAFALLEEQPILEREIMQLQPGDLLGEEWLIKGKKSSTQIRTQQPSTLLTLPQRQLTHKLEEDRGFAARFYRGIALLLTERLLQLKPKLRTSELKTIAHQGREVLFTFGRLHDSDIDWMITHGTCQKLKPGTILLQEGRPAQTLYLLLNGLVKVMVADTTANPLDLAFAALGTHTPDSLGKEIARLRPGEFIGEMPFGETRLASSSVVAVAESLVLAIPSAALKLKQQQDVGWAVRFEKLLATLAIERFRETIHQLGYGKRFYHPGQSLEPSWHYDDELDIESLDHLNLAGSRFHWMLNRLELQGYNHHFLVTT